MNKQYSSEFKLESVKRIKKTGELVSMLAAKLRVKLTTMQGGVKKDKQSPQAPFSGSGHLSPEDEKLIKFEIENRELKEKAEILKKRKPSSIRI